MFEILDENSRAKKTFMKSKKLIRINNQNKICPQMVSESLFGQSILKCNFWDLKKTYPFSLISKKCYWISLLSAPTFLVNILIDGQKPFARATVNPFK